MRGWSVERWLTVATFVVSLFAFTFGLGVNWARITQQEAQLKSFEQTYVRGDVYASDQRRLSESVDRLTRAIEKMQETPQSQTPLGRMFDR